MKIRMYSIRFKLVFYCFVSMICAFLSEMMMLSIAALLQWILRVADRSSSINQNINNGIGNNHNYSTVLHLFRLTDNRFWNFVLIISVFFVLVLLFYILFTRQLIEQIRSICSGTKIMSQGDFSTHIAVCHQDELGELAEQLNNMQNVINKRLVQEQQMEQTKNALITNVAHDLRTPLTSIKGYADLLLKEDITFEKRIKYSNIIVSKTNHLQGLIESLFEYTKYYDRDNPFQLQKMDVGCFLEQITDEFYPDFCNADLHCETEISSNLFVMADGEKLARAFNNILSNAIKYGKDGKLIQVFAKHQEQWIEIRVVNYGNIIEEKDLEHLFDKFYRVEKSRSLNTGGTGLGLAITKTIIERHNGTIEVTSSEAGTMIKIMLPVAGEEQHNEHSK